MKYINKKQSKEQSKKKSKKNQKILIKRTVNDLTLKNHFDNKSNKNIILTNLETDLSFLKVDLSKYYLFNNNPYLLMDDKYLIPNYFNHIIVLSDFKHKINEDSILNLYNMLLVDGILTISKKFISVLKNYNVEISDYEFSKLYINVKKLDNSVYNIIKGEKSIVDCLLIGVQKASTTSALINLLKHKDIGGPKDEIHFFDIYWYKGIGYLKNQMNPFKNKKIKIIKNPELIYLDSTYPLIQTINPFMKFILFLRNPIDRAYSSWQMVYNNGWTTKNFEDSIFEEFTIREKEPKTFYTGIYHYLRRGLYYQQIQTFLQWFPKQSLKIFVIEKYENHEVIYNEIYKFLNLQVPKEKIEYTKERIGTYSNKIDNKQKKILEKYFKNDIESLEKFLGYKTGWISNDE
jgi:hypothetical protein